MAATQAMDYMRACAAHAEAVVTEYIPHEYRQYAWPALWTVLGLLVVWVVLAPGSDKPIRYSVPEITYPEEKRILEKPSIEVLNSDAIQCYAPATGEFLGLVQSATPRDIDAAIDAAHAAQKKWQTTSFRERRAVLRTLLQYVLDHQESICRVSCVESGKTMVDAQLGEILVTAEKLQWTIKHGEAALRPSRRPTNLLLVHKSNTVVYEPMGVVAALVSWNYPFHNLIGPAISSIFAGNGIVVKVSEQCAWSAPHFTSIVQGALIAHGHDPALCQSVVCYPQTSSHMTSHPRISHITFIGSQSVAQKVAASAATALIPVCAELGGKDPAIILDSASGRIDTIAQVLMRGTFQASGQNCVGIERIIATPKCYEALLSLLEPAVRNLRSGQDKDVGSMISDTSFARLESLIEDAVRSGARLLAGGKRRVLPEFPSGHYFAPTLLVDVTHDMAIAHEECFGPIMVLMRATSNTVAGVLDVANAPNFGLGSCIFGDDNDPVLKGVVKGLKAGMVAVNDFAVFYAAHLPFGGVGGSGYGRFAGEEGLRSVCNSKSICADRFGWAGVRTGLPPPVRYPIADQERSWRFTKGVVQLGYETGVRKVGGLINLLKSM